MQTAQPARQPHPARRPTLRHRRPRSNNNGAAHDADAHTFDMGTLAQSELYRLIGAAHARGERVVVATVAHTRGSTPQRRGAKMLFFAQGDVAGTVGGGCIEAEVWAEA